MLFNIGLKDIVDIILTALLLFGAYKLLRKSGASAVFVGVLTFVIVWFVVSQVLRMELLGGILDGVISVGAFALIVLFQTEIKRFFLRIGSSKNWGVLNYLKRFLMKNNETESAQPDYDIIQIVLACRSMARTATGGLIVLTRENNLEFFVQTGEIVDSRISSRLIENIFFKNSPLHDGALIISNRRLRAAACILPVSNNQNIPKRLGLRHRAALGVTEQSDAIAIIISEETGQISWAVNGKLTINAKPEELEHFLSEEMKEQK
ncbi:MAG TPA: TIGR00159 family protein [Bacteroidales bacterium]|nr:TIGR00159 family protein [Bacteroidales bacterium]